MNLTRAKSRPYLGANITPNELPSSQKKSRNISLYFVSITVYHYAFATWLLSQPLLPEASVLKFKLQTDK